MPKLHYSVAFIDLSKSKEKIFKTIQCRTDIRKAQKNNVMIEIFDQKPLPNLLKIKCKEILEKLSRKKLFPYSYKFDLILEDSNNIFFIAKKEEKIISFIAVSPVGKFPNDEKKKTAYLSLSATDENFLKISPNYLLIWTAICYLIDKGYDYFNLGLLNYIETPNKELEKTAFFKRKWNVQELVLEEKVSILRYLYYKFLKNIIFFKKIVYFFQKFLVK